VGGRDRWTAMKHEPPQARGARSERGSRDLAGDSKIHQARRAWMPTAERDRAAFQFRQGIGRLMRREGARDQRLWVLDGRIWEPNQKWLFAPVKAILTAYQR